MAKRFSVIDCGKRKVVVTGYLEPDILHEVPAVVTSIWETPIHMELNIAISHILFLDFKDAPIEDASQEEVEILQEELPNFYDKPKFFDLGPYHTEEIVELSVRGLLGEEKNDTQRILSKSLLRDKILISLDKLIEKLDILQIKIKCKLKTLPPL